MSNPIIEKIENEFDKEFYNFNRSVHPSTTVEIKSFYRQKITELLDALAKEAIGLKRQYIKSQLPLTSKLEDWLIVGIKNGDVNQVFYYLQHILSDFRNNTIDEVISAFNKIGIKIK